MIESGLFLTNKELSVLNIDKNQVKAERAAISKNAPRVFHLTCSVVQAEHIARRWPTVRIVSPSLGLNRADMLELSGGVLHGPVAGFRNKR